MDATLLLAPLVLATDFVAAALTKLADRKGSSRQTMTIFGLPATLLVALFTNVLEGDFSEDRIQHPAYPGPSSCPYSPKCVEEEFSEVDIQHPAYLRS
jgi:hypothetical protein